MGRRLIRLAAAAALILLPGCVNISRATPTALPASGYLDSASLDALSHSFTPSPQPLEWTPEPAAIGPGTDRWWLAIAHAELRAPEAAQHFDCILGTRLDQSPRPALTRLMNRLLVDSEGLSRRLTAEHPRIRPIKVQPELAPCQRIPDGARDTPSWPAGGAVMGAAYGRLFSDLAPDQRTRLQDMGREIGVSRQICRMNWAGDVRDGQAIGQALYDRAAATPAFAADLEAARAEIVAARAEGLTNPSCAAERRALGVRIN